MKREMKAVIALATLLFAVIMILFLKNYISYVNLRTITKNPFNTIEILGQKIRLKDNERTYKIETDCKTLTDENVQILYYRLNEKNKDYKITVSNKIFNGQNVITTDYSNITEIETNISIFDPKNKYEQIYHITSTCKIDEAASKKEEEEKNNQKKDDSNKSTKKTTKK